MSVAFPGEAHPHTEAEDPRIETALDQGLFNQCMADASETGSWPQDDMPAKTIPAQRKLGFPEAAAADREPPRHERLTEQERTERQAVLAGEGRQAAVAAARHSAHRAIARKAAGNSVLEAAMRRAYDVRHDRP